MARDPSRAELRPPRVIPITSGAGTCAPPSTHPTSGATAVERLLSVTPHNRRVEIRGALNAIARMLGKRRAEEIDWTAVTPIDTIFVSACLSSDFPTAKAHRYLRAVARVIRYAGGAVASLEEQPVVAARSTGSEH